MKSFFKKKLGKFLRFIFIIGLGAMLAVSCTLNREIENIVQPLVDDGTTVGAAIGIISENHSQQFFFGEKSQGKGVLPDQNTLFEIGSIDKTFTATILAKFVLDGELELDEPVKNYLPELTRFPEYQGQQITFRNLADHTSSLPTWVDYEDLYDGTEKNVGCDRRCVPKMKTFLENYQLTHPIDSQWEYGNFAYGLLGHILGSIKGVCIEQLMKEYIWDELGMTDIYNNIPQDYTNIAMPHDENGNTVPFLNLEYCYRGSGGSKANLKNMMKYLKANMGLTETTLYPAMQLARKPTNSLGEMLETGLGWRITDYIKSKNSHLILKTGGTWGSNAIIAFVPEQQIGVVILFNSSVDRKEIDGLRGDIYVALKILEAMQWY